MTSLCLVTGPSFSPVVVDVSGQLLPGTSCNSSSLYSGQLPPHTLCVATDCQVIVCQDHIQCQTSNVPVKKVKEMHYTFYS